MTPESDLKKPPVRLVHVCRGLAWLLVMPLSCNVLAGWNDDPILAKLMIDQLELRDTGGDNPRVLEAGVWSGRDLQKIWLKADLERVGGHTEEAGLQALYSHAIAPYWDLQVGVRKDFRPDPKRSWAVLGLQGLAPYFFEVDAALFVGESGRTGLRVSAEYELLFTQQLILSPELEFDAYGQNDADHGTGSGLSDVQAGLRLRYEMRREFAPYVGLNWNRKYGNAADYARQEREPVHDSQFVIGIRAWF